MSIKKPEYVLFQQDMEVSVFELVRILNNIVSHRMHTKLFYFKFYYYNCLL